MRLVHFSKKEIEKLVPKEVCHDKFRYNGKPDGLWVSDEDEYGWKAWCEDNNYGENSFLYSYEIVLKETNDILIITTPSEFLDFVERFYNLDIKMDESNVKYNSQLICWNTVSKFYNGIIISPYFWEFRTEYMWYYGWDCASGCIWNVKDSIATFEPMV